MKRRLFIQAIIISFLFLVLISAVAYWDFTSWNKRMESLNNVPPRRFADSSHWHSVNNYEYNFFRVSLEQFDNAFLKTLYLLVILQSFFLIRGLKVKSGFLIVGYLLSSIVGGFSIFAANSFRDYFVTGLNPYLMYVPIFFLVLQIVIWVYLNMFHFRKLAEVKLER